MVEGLEFGFVLSESGPVWVRVGLALRRPRLVTGRMWARLGCFEPILSSFWAVFGRLGLSRRSEGDFRGQFNVPSSFRDHLKTPKGRTPQMSLFGWEIKGEC